MEINSVPVHRTESACIEGQKLGKSELPQQDFHRWRIVKLNLCMCHSPSQDFVLQPLLIDAWCLFIVM